MANRNARRPGRRKGSPKTGGRKAGTPNRVTVEARAAAAEIVDSAAYRRRLAARARHGELPSGMEMLLWHYAKGRPLDDSIPAAQVLAFVSGVTTLFLDVVVDESLRRAFALGLRRKLGAGWRSPELETERAQPEALPAGYDPAKDEMTL